MYMRLLFYCLPVFLCLAIVPNVAAQDIAPLLKNLSADQKRQVLAYIAELGVGLDAQVKASFGALDAEGKRKLSQYLQAVQPQDGGKIRRTTVAWSRDTLHFGQLQEGTVYIDSVTVTNTGTAPYSITDFKTACDCAVLKAPTRALLPGEQAVVRIEFNSLGKKGKVTTGIVLQDTSTPNARSILYLKGEVTVQRKGPKQPWED
jgi:hypothetical protein